MYERNIYPAACAGNSLRKNCTFAITHQIIQDQCSIILSKDIGKHPPIAVFTEYNHLSKKEIMLSVQRLSYIHPDKEVLFSDISFVLQKHQKASLIGNNGTGKSTLLKIVASELSPSAGEVKQDARLYYIPQLLGQYDALSVAASLGVAHKLNALTEILSGHVTEENMAILDDDWGIEERCREAFTHWQVSGLPLDQLMGNLSGGQKTKVLLAGISIHQPDCILMDEPGNHLDMEGRKMLYDLVQQTTATLLIVSHDRILLNLADTTYELSKRGITAYGGNYAFYAAQKQLEQDALHQDLQAKEKALRKAKEKERDTIERQQRLDTRGKQKQEKAGTARIMMNALRNKAENSTAKAKAVHNEKKEGIAKDLQALREVLPDTDKMKFDFDESDLHKGKILFAAKNINYRYGAQRLWKHDLDLEITSGERISLQGTNGSGKTTLLKIISGTMEPATGSVYRSDNSIAYIDQDYSLLNHELSVYKQAQAFNNSGLQEHEVKIRLHRFLFGREDWDKPCSALSGGERMRLALCCLTIAQKAPDILMLDEPTNNLDIQNTAILSKAVKEYQGTLIVVSHDKYFLTEVATEKIINLERP